MFWVVSGRLRLEFRNQDPIVLEAGEIVVVPRGVEHRPVAEPTAHVVLFEPAAIKHTGNVETDRTVHDLPRL
ncbi:MAG: cupin domain-containing protein [Rubrivirga sp.]